MHILHLYLEKKQRSVKKRIKHQKVIHKRLQSNNFKMQCLFNLKISPDLYCGGYLNLVNKGLTGLTRLALFCDVTSLWPLELSSNKDVFERFTFHVGDERWFSQQIGWFSIVLHLYNVTGQTLASQWIVAFDLLKGFIFSVEPISRIFMPLCLLALWYFWLSLLAHSCCSYLIGWISTLLCDRLFISLWSSYRKVFLEECTSIILLHYSHPTGIRVL